MPWIESHQRLERHPKLLDLCNKTGWNLDEAIGKLHRLWWWTLDFAEDGLLGNFSPTQFLSAIITGNLTAENLLKILKDTNFIDKNNKIHDWWDYAGRYLTAKYRTSNLKYLERIERIYKSSKSLPKVRLKSAHQPTIPTLPNQDNQIISQITDLLGQFPATTQEKIKIFWDRARLKNKSETITEGRKLTILNELFNSRQRCNDDTLFDYALEMANSYDAPNIGYVNKVWANKKTERPR